MLVDTHAHINETFYQDDYESIVSFAIEKNVKKIICAGTSLTDSRLNLEMARKFPGVIYPAVGIHPHNEGADSSLSIDEQLSGLDELIGKNRENIVAVGECGLDFSGDTNDTNLHTNMTNGNRMNNDTNPLSHDEQRKIFLSQIDLAIKYKLPLLLHVNKTYDEVLEIFSSDNLQSEICNLKLRGVFHCYTGGKKRIQKIVDLGFYFGIGGLVTYDEGIMQVVREIPLERILLETDCPFLAPVPHRGERNQPGYLPLITTKIAELKDVTIEEVERVTTENAIKLLRNL
ncbi:TatD family hydrolase [Candidatus Microgenomates bacterium]|nr:TatD family hydrolase [Candidatus Microgenomates bacterium]